MSRAAYRPRLRQALLSALALLIAGPADVASAWARTRAGVGLVGGSAGFAALAWLALRRRAHRQTVMHRKLKFAAVPGSLLALICLPFGAAIGAITHVSWFG
jgi:hypothetical protein